MAQVLTRVHGTARQIPEERLPSFIVIANKQYLGLIARHNGARNGHITTVSHFFELDDAPQAPLEESTGVRHFESLTDTTEFCPESVINFHYSQSCLLIMPPAAQRSISAAGRTADRPLQIGKPPGTATSSPRTARARVGAGLAGMRAALESADLGVEVVLVERAREVGGNVGALGEMYPSGREGAEVASALRDEIRARANIILYTNAELVAKSGHIGDFDVAPASFDAALCVGSTEAYGGYRDTLRELAATVRPHGRMLVGERFWRHRPHPDYLAALGAGADDLLDHARNVRAAEEAGLVPICTAVATEEEWDHYERLRARALEDHARLHPDDPEAEAIWRQSRRHAEAYEHWGRDTLGFGLYVFQRK